MKVRRLFLAGSLAVVLACAHALGAASLTVGTGNDWITMGFGNNEDDGHSFSVFGAFEADNGLAAHLILDGFTDQRDTATRYSTLAFTLSYPITHRLRPQLSLTVQPAIGTLLAGALGLEALQNLLHRILGRDEVYASEAYEGLLAMPVFSARALLSAQSGHQHIEAAITLQAIPAWQRSMDLSLLWSFDRLITVGLGIVCESSSDDTAVRMRERAQKTGPYLLTRYDSSLLHTSWTIWGQTGFSWGTFGFDPLAFGQTPRFEHSDLSIIGGIYYDLLGYQSRVSGLVYKHLLVQVHYSNGPVAPQSTFRRNIGLWSVGWRWEPRGATSLLSPSLSLLAGAKRYNVLQHIDQGLVDEVHPTIGMEVGLTLGSSHPLIVGPDAYRLAMSVAVHYTLGSVSVPSIHPRWEEIARPLSLLFGLVLYIDHDLNLH